MIAVKKREIPSSSISRSNMCVIIARGSILFDLNCLKKDSLSDLPWEPSDSDCFEGKESISRKQPA